MSRTIEQPSGQAQPRRDLRVRRALDEKAGQVLGRGIVVSAAAALAAAGFFGCGSDSAGPSEAGPACMPIDPPATCPSPPPSYKSEIAFIVANDCASANCHVGGGAESVHDFTTYRGVYADHLTFAQQVALCPSSSSGMPPLGYPQPTAAQRADLVAWASICGAPDN